jgi:putative hemolysin
LPALILYLALLVFFVLLSVFFSAAETAYIALNRRRLKYQEDAGDRKAGVIHRIVSNPDRLLGVILFGVTMAEIAAAGLVTSLITAYVAPEHNEIAGLAGSVGFSFFVLIICELTPKIIAAAHPEQLSRKLLPAVRFFLVVFSPFARLAAWLANGIVSLAGLDSVVSPFPQGASQEEIKAMIADAGEASVPNAKKLMLHNVFDIDTKQIREVMIPRGEVTAIDIDADVADILDTVNKTNYSRVPVYRKGFDNPLGILHVKDLLQYLQKGASGEGKVGEISIDALLRPIHFVPDSARLDAVLRRLQAMRLHMAVVVDEFGGVAGIVTLEDLLEEIVGEIQDEHDSEADAVRDLGANVYSIAGNLPVRDFNRSFDDKIPEAPEYTTVAGFLESLTERLLEEGETVRYGSLSFTIEQASGFRIDSIRVRAHAENADSPRV